MPYPCAATINTALAKRHAQRLQAARAPGLWRAVVTLACVTPPPNPSAGRAAFAGARLHVVTGKGGAGKTTVAASLAVALARGGKRVLLCEVEGRQACSRLLDCPPLDYTERPVMAGRHGGSVQALAVEPRAALMDYLNTFYVMGGRAGKMLDSLGAVDFATTIAPGLRDVLLTGKVYEAAKRTVKRRRGEPARPAFDAVVVDAPPTGRITRFLNVSAQVTGLAKMGPIHAQAASMEALMHAPTTRVHVVALPEEMSVTESREAVAELAAEGFSVGAVFVNRVRPQVLSDADLARVAAGQVSVGQLTEAISKAGGDGAGPAHTSDEAGAELAEDLVALGAQHAARVAREAEQVAVLADLPYPLLRVPLSPVPITRALLPDMADNLMAQGVQ